MIVFNISANKNTRILTNNSVKPQSMLEILEYIPYSNVLPLSYLKVVTCKQRITLNILLNDIKHHLCVSMLIVASDAPNIFTLLEVM